MVDADDVEDVLLMTRWMRRWLLMEERVESEKLKSLGRLIEP